jgi:hypothetical protein
MCMAATRSPPAVAARIHDAASNADEARAREGEIDVVEVEPAVDVQRLAFFLRTHARIERGYVDAGAFPLAGRSGSPT